MNRMFETDNQEFKMIILHALKKGKEDFVI